MMQSFAFVFTSSESVQVFFYIVLLKESAILYFMVLSKQRKYNITLNISSLAAKKVGKI